jgi:phage repressor protein C with HTH and peptisase S24 domain
MFKQESNAAFNNGLFSAERIAFMHETTERLYLAARILKKTEGQSAVARLLNTSPQTVKNWESRGVSRQGMIDAQRLIGCRSTWIETGEGEMVDSPASSLLPEDSALIPISLSDHPDLVEVPRVKFKLSAGVSGFAIDVEQGNGKPIFFRDDWFKVNGYRPEKLFAVRIYGQSMEPRLWEGDLVVINTADATPKDGEPFALNYEGELVIKRLRRDAGEWWACSDNPDQQRYAPKRCTEDVKIIGMVVYRQGERI